MAHYIAVKGSRYQFSHETEYMPIRTLSNYLRGEPCFMHLSLDSNDKRTPFCSAMNYIYHPSQFENMCPYSFWTWVEVITVTQARERKLDKKAWIKFPDNHPQHSKKICVMRSKPVVPQMDWTFFGDAKNLSVPMTEAPHHSRWKNVTKSNEEHCRKFLVAFLPFRCEADLTIHNSYKAKFISEHSNGTFNKFTKIADNIQNIRNSLAAGRMNDDMPAEEVDPDTSELDNTKAMEEIESRISAIFGHGKDFTPLDSEPTHFNSSLPQLPETQSPSAAEDFEDINVIQKQGQKKKHKGKVPIHLDRFVPDVAGVNGLNTLVQQTFTTGTFEEETETVEAIGTAESIMTFGYNRNLDLDQQTAFEILAATFVASFVREAIARAQGDGNTEDTEELKKKLLELDELAQTKQLKGKPLRMFLTGPAGAGKCTSPHFVCCDCHKPPRLMLLCSYHPGISHGLRPILLPTHWTRV